MCGHRHLSVSQKPWQNNGDKLTVETGTCPSCTIRPVQLMMTGEKGYFMKKYYGIWRVVLQTSSGETVKQDVTAWSGRNARARIEKFYEGCEIFKMTRVAWLTGFSRAQLSAALLNFDPNYGQALIDILADNGVFVCPDEAPSDVD